MPVRVVRVVPMARTARETQATRVAQATRAARPDPAAMRQVPVIRPAAGQTLVALALVLGLAALGLATPGLVVLAREALVLEVLAPAVPVREARVRALRVVMVSGRTVLVPVTPLERTRVPSTPGLVRSVPHRRGKVPVAPMPVAVVHLPLCRMGRVT